MQTLLLIQPNSIEKIGAENSMIMPLGLDLDLIVQMISIPMVISILISIQI